MAEWVLCSSFMLISVCPPDNAADNRLNVSAECSDGYCWVGVCEVMHGLIFLYLSTFLFSILVLLLRFVLLLLQILKSYNPQCEKQAFTGN